MDKGSSYWGVKKEYIHCFHVLFSIIIIIINMPNHVSLGFSEFGPRVLNIRRTKSSSNDDIHK